MKPIEIVGSFTNDLYATCIFREQRILPELTCASREEPQCRVVLSEEQVER